MMTDDLCSLSYDTYSDNLKIMVQEMSRSDKFTDVTLVSDDKKHKKAHTFILSAFSNVFKGIIENIPEKNSIIYLKGIEYQELESVLEFIYFGKTQVSLEKITEFLHVANSLEIKEFKEVKKEYAASSTSLQNAHEGMVHETSNRENVAKPGKNVSDGGLDSNSRLENTMTIVTEPISNRSMGYDTNPSEDTSNKDGHESTEASNTNSNSDDLENSVNNDDIEKEENQFHKDVDLEKLNYKTTGEQNVADPKTDLLDNNQELKRDQAQQQPFQCNQCDYKSHVKPNLQAHLKQRHSGVTFACEYDECNKNFSNQTRLNTHTKTAHEGFRFSCNYCRFRTTLKGNLKKHTEAKHEGIRYTCSICNKQFTLQDTLKKHVKAKHEGVTYDCNFCKKKISTDYGLKVHILRRHTKHV